MTTYIHHIPFSMAEKLLKITKPDQTTHVVPAANKAFYQKRNRLAKKDDQWKIESITAEQAKDLAFIDENYVTGAAAVEKADKLQGQLTESQQEIANLKKQLADAQAGGPKYSAAQAIALIGVAKTAEEVDEVAKGDDRTTVKDAAKQRKSELKAQ